MEDRPAASGEGGMAQIVPRIVLDTNACLDLFLFRDARAAALLAAMRSGEVAAVTDSACREEWLRVLRYPQLAIDDAARGAAMSAFDALVRCVDAKEPAGATPLPRCADPDDQKFLSLARDAGAHWLVSRDDELLKLGRRTRRDGLFGIIEPCSWPSVGDQISNR
ncbi:PIN domain-containing protein [Lysobacter niastensis]|nr:PIN domain-containing protein [Lysobacter niastensis]